MGPKAHLDLGFAPSHSPMRLGPWWGGAPAHLGLVPSHTWPTLLGNVAEIQNFLRITKINLWSHLATRERGVHLHTLVDRERKRSRERG